MPSFNFGGSDSGTVHAVPARQAVPSVAVVPSNQKMAALPQITTSLNSLGFDLLNNTDDSRHVPTTPALSAPSLQSTGATSEFLVPLARKQPSRFKTPLAKAAPAPADAEAAPVSTKTDAEAKVKAAADADEIGRAMTNQPHTDKEMLLVGIKSEEPASSSPNLASTKEAMSVPDSNLVPDEKESSAMAEPVAKKKKTPPMLDPNKPRSKAGLPEHEILKVQVAFRDEIQDYHLQRIIKKLALEVATESMIEALPIRIALSGANAFAQLLGKKNQSQGNEGESIDAAAATSTPGGEESSVVGTKRKRPHSKLDTLIAAFQADLENVDLAKQVLEEFVSALNKPIVSTGARSAIRDGLHSRVRELVCRLGTINQTSSSASTDAKKGGMHKDRNRNAGADVKLAVAALLDRVEPHQFTVMDNYEYTALRELDRYHSYTNKLELSLPTPAGTKTEKEAAKNVRKTIEAGFVTAADNILCGSLRKAVSSSSNNEDTDHFVKHVLNQDTVSTLELWLSDRVSQHNIAVLEATRATYIIDEYDKHIKKEERCKTKKTKDRPLKNKVRGQLKPAPIYAPVDISSI
jgi:hypothetical protein